MKLQRLALALLAAGTARRCCNVNARRGQCQIAVIDPLRARLATLARPWCVIHS